MINKFATTCALLTIGSAQAAVITYSTSFESPDFTLGPISPTGGPTQGGWSGGAQAGFTNNTSDPGSVYDEGITNAVARTGANSWHMMRGYDSAGPGTPFTPELAVDAGQPSSGAAADNFKATFWVLAADSAGDDSRIMVAGGNPAGTDRSSNYLEIENVAGAGLTIRTYNGVSGGGWTTSELLIATGLDATQWHKIELEASFMDGPDNDTWTYRVNDGAPVVGGAYFETARDNFGFGYETTNRLKFQSRHADGNADPSHPTAPYFAGFYFDDLSYEVTVPDVAPIPEPSTVGLLALGSIALMRRRRR